MTTLHDIFAGEDILCPSCKDDSKTTRPDRGSQNDDSESFEYDMEGSDSSGDEDKDLDSGRTGAGAGSTKPPDKESVEALKKAASDFINKVREDDELQQEVQQIRTSVSQQSSKSFLEKDQKFSNMIPSLGGRAIRKRFIDEIGLLRQQSDPGWDPRRDAGRVNVSRYIRTRNGEEAFDLWREGASDACDIEAVIALDVSGSMSGHDEATAEAMWVIKSALDAVDASTTVITYSGYSKILYSASDKTLNSSYRYNFRGGGTSPGPALEEACNIFFGSNRRTKILISITDGDWPGSPQDYVNALTKGGVHTAMLYYPTLEAETTEDAIRANNAYGHQTFVRVDQPKDIIKFARTLVTNLIKERM